MVNPYTKEGMELLCILPYASVNAHVVNGQRLKFNAINGQSPEISVVNSQTLKMAGQSHDYRVNGSDTLFHDVCCDKPQGVVTPIHAILRGATRVTNCDGLNSAVTS